MTQRVDAGHGGLDARLNHLFGELFVVEDDHFFDVAHAALEVFAEGHDLANHDGRARDGLEHAHLAALDALGDFDFALARQQRHGAHLAQVHAHRVVGLFQGARRQVELDILALFQLEVLVAELGAVEQVDALGADGGDQVVQIVGRGCHLVRQHVVDVAVGEIALFLADLDQGVNIVIVIVVMVVLVFMCKFFVDRQNTPFLLRKCDAAPSCARCGTGCKAHKVKIFRHKSGKRRICTQTCGHPHKKAVSGVCSEQDDKRFRIHLGRPRAKAHGWGRGARIRTETFRIPLLSSFSPTKNRAKPESSSRARDRT